MRLLEFNKDEGGANPRRPGGKPETRKTASVSPLPAPRQRTATPKSMSPAKRGFPINGNTLPKPVTTPPIDIEQLQERIAVLEKRLTEVSARSGKQATVRELIKLQQRMRSLESNLDNEIWQARQREHTMLEILTKNSLKERIRTRFTRFVKKDIHAIRRFLKGAFNSWWDDSQPGWWPGLARNWKESLDKARGR
jgi:hypothetical protein